MKRILLLPFLAVLTAPVLMAATTWEPDDQRFSTEDGYSNPLQNRGVTDFVGNVRQVKNGSVSHANGVINIGTYAGEGTLTIDEDVTSNAGNCVFIGGRGWHTDPLPEDKPALNEHNGYDGTLNVNKGAVFSNGMDSNLTTYAGAQFIVGHGKAKGTLNIDGGTVNSNGGMFVIGNSSEGEGVVNISNGGILNANLPTKITQTSGNASWLLLGNSDGAKATLNVESGSSLTVSSDRTDCAVYTYIGYVASSDASVNVSGGSTVDFGDATYVGVFGKGALTAQGQGTTIETGHLYIYNADSSADFSEGVTVKATGDLFVAGTLNNSGDITVSGSATFESGSTTTNSGTIRAKEISVYSNAVLTNTGILESTGNNSGINLDDGATINNEGTLNGQISGAGTVQGTGEIGTVSVGTDTTLVVGSSDAPIVGLAATSITLKDSSSTQFNIAGTTQVNAGESAGWDDGKHSIIFSETVTIESGAAIELAFGNNMFEVGENTEFDMLLIAGDIQFIDADGNIVTDVTAALDALLANTHFSLAAATLQRRSSGPMIDASNLTYTLREAVDSNPAGLYLTGTASVVIPEPTSSVLGLAGLVALSLRRRRK